LLLLVLYQYHLMKYLYTLLLVAAGSVALAQSRTFIEKQQKSAEVVSPKDFEAVQIDGSKKAKLANKGLIAASQNRLLRAKIIRDSLGLPVFIEYSKKLGNSSNGRVALSAAAMAYIHELKGVLSLKNPEQELEIGTIEDDELQMTHIRLQQTFKGLNVYGGEMILHTQNNEITTLNGRVFPTPTLKNTTANISQSKAIELAINTLKKETVVRELTTTEKQFIKKHAPESELLIYHPNSDLANERLAWQLTIRPNFIERWVFFVDAQSGEILYKNNHTCALDGTARATATDLNGTARSMNVYLKGNTYYMIDVTKGMFKANTSTLPNNPVGAIWTVDARNSTEDDISIAQIASTTLNTWTPTAVSAHYNAGVAYDYYLNVHKRNSLNNNGGTMISVVNITDEEGKTMGNAFWNGEIMGYGNGDSFFKPLPGGLDVAAHEMTHGVIENEANLEYQGQSGAINESLADVFGVLVDRANWTIGEQVVKAGGFPSGALRSMSNPNQGGTTDPGYQPRTMTQYVSTTKDNGGVHINSGIPNYAFYLFANNSNVGKDKAERVYYRAMTTYLTRISKFIDLRLAIVKATSDIYGATSAEVTAAKSAFDQVGIVESTNPNPTTPQQQIPTNSGVDAVLVYGTVDETIYSTTPTASPITTKIKRKILNHPSVTDDGQFAYYVSSDKKIRAINLVGTVTETLISDEAIWSNVAISKDGKKLAAVTETADKLIYVYSYDRKEWKKFKLYNPTYSQGVSTGDVQYADGIEWDQSSQYLVYDAFNKIKSVTGEKVDYWDVGFLNAWDNTSNTFGDGTIEKLYSDLDPGESIGNPSFAKNSVNVIAFDYFYETDKTYAILGADIETGKASLITNNTTLGYPNFSRLDDRIVFNSLAGSVEYVSILGLGADKVSPKGTATQLLKNAKWPVWYAQGTRALPTIAFDAIPDKYTNDVPFMLKATNSSGQAVSYIVVSGPAKISGNVLTINGIGTVVVRAYSVSDNRFSPAAAVERSFRVLQLLAIPNLNSANISVYPNPIVDEIRVSGLAQYKIEVVEIYDVLGRKTADPLYQKTLNTLVISTPNLLQGPQILRIKTDAGVITQKILKE
jgi:bacillolysin